MVVPTFGRRRDEMPMALEACPSAPGAHAPWAQWQVPNLGQGLHIRTVTRTKARPPDGRTGQRQDRSSCTKDLLTGSATRTEASDRPVDGKQTRFLEKPI